MKLDEAVKNGAVTPEAASELGTNPLGGQAASSAFPLTEGRTRVLFTCRDAGKGVKEVFVSPANQVFDVQKC